MQLFNAFFSLLCIVVCLYSAKLLVALTALNIPAPLVGLVMLFILLHWRIIKPQRLANTSQFLIKYLPLFFIPVGVGFISDLNTITDNLLLIGLLLTLLPCLVLILVGKLASKGRYRD
ncbi:CidA/LrgA family protein [Pseudoalteromonas luteoviolacea]|uniref:CidA/LrgA family protein n=1 Tax=Pseudoalteromonas luteoviolacea TaxID=43657 RepID=UPI0031BBB766|nr:CidA/LrgA family protein [Pseudoalteromonas luteoviolacea]